MSHFREFCLIRHTAPKPSAAGPTWVKIDARHGSKQPRPTHVGQRIINRFKSTWWAAGPPVLICRWPLYDLIFSSRIFFCFQCFFLFGTVPNPVNMKRGLRLHRCLEQERLTAWLSIAATRLEDGGQSEHDRVQPFFFLLLFLSFFLCFACQTFHLRIPYAGFGCADKCEDLLTESLLAIRSSQVHTGYDGRWKRGSEWKNYKPIAAAAKKERKKKEKGARCLERRDGRKRAPCE